MSVNTFINSHNTHGKINLNVDTGDAICDHCGARYNVHEGAGYPPSIFDVLNVGRQSIPYFCGCGNPGCLWPSPEQIARKAKEDQLATSINREGEEICYKPKTAADFLSDGADTYRERNAVYGDSYKNFGPVMMALFPDGLPELDADGCNRLGVLVLIVSKLQRYSQNIASGGHADSALDGMVYFAMLREITDGGL